MSGTLAHEGRHDGQGWELPVGSRPLADSEWESVVGELYAVHYGSLLGLARYLVGNQHAADVVQQSFLEILYRRPTLHVPGAELPYLRTVIRNTAMSALSQQRRFNSVLAALRPGRSSVLASAEEAVVANLEASSVLSIMRELPPRQRETLALAMEGLQPSEIAKVLGIEPNAVRVSLHHARAKVQAHLAADRPAA